MKKFSTELPSDKISRILDRIYNENLPIAVNVALPIKGITKVTFLYEDNVIFTKVYYEHN